LLTFDELGSPDDAGNREEFGNAWPTSRDVNPYDAKN
jgi:hypothetical protein